MRFYFAVVTFFLLLVGTAMAETPMDRCLKVYTQAECNRLQNTYVDSRGNIIPPSEPEISQPIRIARTTYTHLMPSCEPEANPPEAWLRPNGFCALTDQTQKKSLIYTGADYWFGFKS